MRGGQACSRCGGNAGSSCLIRLLAVVLGLVAIAWLIKRCRPRREPGEPATMAVPTWAYRRPDPLLYSQAYLSSLGLAVTWDNPDITVERAGVVVDQHSLAPATDYDVVVRVWNGSTSGPAVDLPVRVSYLDFGIGTISVPVGTTTVDLPVKGAPGSPALCRVPWTTPSTPGHYCLQALLEWSDDENPGNNLGQSNVDVRPLNSPTATFEFPLRNDGRRPQALRLAADAYAIPPVDACDERPDPATVRRRHDRGAYPVPEGWSVDISPSEAVLRAGESLDVTVIVTAPDGFGGRMTINVNAFEGDALRGGVTLTAEGVV
jgi:hypothetical protein